MALGRKQPYGYSKMEKEDPEEMKHRKAQFLIYKVMEQADSRRKASWLRIRTTKLKVRIGKRLRRFRKRIMSSVSAAKAGFHGHVIAPLKTWRRLFCGSGTQQHIISLPPMFK